MGDFWWLLGVQGWQTSVDYNFSKQLQMKIKLQQQNREKSHPDFKPRGKENQNPLNTCLSSKHMGLVREPQTIHLPSFLRKENNTEEPLRPYEEDILAYLLSREEQFGLARRHKKAILKNSKRIKIVEFFSDLSHKYNLRKKTLFLAAHYFDQYSQNKTVSTLPAKKQAIIAEACIFIAMKYEEIYPPLLKEWSSNIDEVVKAESLILKELNFKLAYTTAQHYLELYLSKHKVESSQKELYQCILQLFLVTGHIYDDHPLKIVQSILDSFRPTLFLEEHLVEVDRSIKLLILGNHLIWENILAQHNKFSKPK